MRPMIDASPDVLPIISSVDGLEGFFIATGFSGHGFGIGPGAGKLVADMFSNWLFTYLVEERKFSLLESGFLYALPFITGAVLAAIGGLTCDALCRRIGAEWGCRLPAMTGLVLVAVFLLLGTYSANPYLAVGMNQRGSCFASAGSPSTTTPPHRMAD